MASSLDEDLSCPVCLEIFQDPQLLSCGHTFCRRCLERHRGVLPLFHAACPVCQQTIHQEPVSNLALRNTCESYQKEKERTSGEVKCPQHGEKLVFFCRDDEQALCSQCRKQRHMSHRVQSLRHSVLQRKDEVKAAVRPAEKVLESLRNNTALECQIKKCIESQGEQTEKQIKKEFEKLHQFLREEEEARRAELRMEEEQKKSKIVEWIELELQSLSDRVMEVEGEMGNDDVTFLANYHSTYRRAQCKPSDSQLNSGSVIDVTKHVGNLRFRVWEKMKDLCPYYPVILNPNSSHMAVSGDLVGASGSARRFYPPNPLQKAANRMVLGSQVLKGKLNCWEVDVGNSKNWTVGVCTRRGAESNQTQPLTPHNGIWGVCRNGDFCDPVGSWGSRFQITKPLKTLRVKLIQRQDFNNGKKMWTLSFADASDNSRIVSLVIDDGVGREFIPFLIPEDVNSPLRIVPVNVNTVTENKFGFFERHKEMMPLYFMVFIVLLMVMMLGFRALFTSQSAK